jgi:hypothetical protein
MSSRPITDEEAVAAADKEMEERANRAKELLSRRYVGLKRSQVGPIYSVPFSSVLLKQHLNFLYSFIIISRTQYIYYVMFYYPHDRRNAKVVK